MQLNLSNLDLPEGKLTFYHVLRHLPKQRAVLEATWEPTSKMPQNVVVKLFFPSKTSSLTATAEINKHRQLVAKEILTPKIIKTLTLADKTELILYEKIAGELALEKTDEQSLSALTHLLAWHHQHGVLQADCHLNNFIFRGDALYTLDSGSIQFFKTPVPFDLALENLVLMLAQWPISMHHLAKKTLILYATRRQIQFDTKTEIKFKKLLQKTVKKRSRRYQKKIFRSSSEFVVVDKFPFVGVIKTTHEEIFKDFFNSPQAFINKHISENSTLKAGSTNTVLSLNINDKSYIVKCYHPPFIKKLASLKAQTRARKSWLNAGRLKSYGILTPSPIAFVEHYRGPFITNSYYICEKLTGDRFYEHFKGLPLDERKTALKPVDDLLQALGRAQLTHGDFKSVNLMYHQNKLHLLDLDSMRAHKKGRRFIKNHLRDKTRFLQSLPSE